VDGFARSGTGALDMIRFDTIVACITGPGPGAVAVIRVSGPEAWTVAENVFEHWPEEPQSHRAYYGTFAHGDDGLCLPFAEGRSYTGEQSAEFSIHGSRASVEGLIQHCRSAGARMAEPGEFTRRAFLNGRLDLSAAEAVHETIRAQTRLELEVARRRREGLLAGQIAEFRQAALLALGAIEATVDFSEEIGDLDGPALADELESTAQGLWDLAERSRLQRPPESGYRVALVGRPNAGKSSLFNALLGEGRAIVTEIPGTTRDTIEELIELGGFPVRLIDTAGLRESQDQVERIGIERTRAASELSHLVLFLFDAAAGWSEEDAEIHASLEAPVIKVASKADLVKELPANTLAVSAKTGAGISQLEAALRAHLQSVIGEDPGTALLNDRHQPEVERAWEAVVAAQNVLRADLPIDLAAVHLRDALDRLGLITGETANVDLVDQIFGQFCIGK